MKNLIINMKTAKTKGRSQEIEVGEMSNTEKLLVDRMDRVKTRRCLSIAILR